MFLATLISAFDLAECEMRLNAFFDAPSCDSLSQSWEEEHTPAGILRREDRDWLC